MIMNIRHLKSTTLSLGAEALLYLAFLIGDWQGYPTGIIKYLSICLCFLWSLSLLRQKQWLIPAAMAFTLLADTFLLLLDQYYLLGVAAFCIVQTLYAIRLFDGSSHRWLMARLAVFGLVLIGLKLARLLDPLTAAAAYSFTQLTLSVLQSWVAKSPKALAAGLTLFWCCDACVGLHNILAYLPNFPLPQLIRAATFCMWLFYLPAQVLIVLSGTVQNRRAAAK